MTDKKSINKKEIIQKQTSDVLPLVERKIEFFKDVIQKTIIHDQKNKILDILGISDVSTCIEKLGELSKKISEIQNAQITATDSIINSLQLINNELSSLLKNYGTESLEDLLLICFGNNNKITTNDTENYKFDLLKKYFHPTSYKVITKKEDAKKKDDMDDKTGNLSCSDVVSVYKQFHMKVYGIKVHIYSTPLKKNLLIYGIVDDVVIDFLNNKFITNKINNINDNIPNDPEFKSEIFKNFLSALMLKDYLICENEKDIYNKFVGTNTQNNLIKQKQISQAVKEFITDDTYSKRSTLLNLLVRSYHYENQYLAYLLYDLLSNDANGNVDSQEQIILFDSFPWSIKQLFKQAMKKTIQYTNELSNFDINKIPLEQQICLLKASDSVKEKAMMKLKEVKAKSEDSGSKARQYLDGLLKIPFGVYKREPILNIMELVRNSFKELHKKYNIDKIFPEIKQKEKYTSVEVVKYLRKIQGNSISTNKNDKLEKIKEYLTTGDKKKLTASIKSLDNILKKYNKKVSKYSHLNKDEISEHIIETIDAYIKEEGEHDKKIIDDIIGEFDVYANINPMLNNIQIKHDIEKINGDMKVINDYIAEVKTTLDRAVHGHDKAKKQIERIIGQWINGEQDGYCFGFEGPPGVGKCLAKNTPIMLYNGDIKMVQDITLEDKLMGDDSKPRNILALGNGKEKMYRIDQIKGDSYIVNESHILSLKMTKSGKKGYKHQIILGNRYLKDEIIDICIKDYLGLPNYIKECLKGYKVGLDFDEQPVDLEPYALGCWLGDGTSKNFSITSIDEPIIKYFEEFAKKYNLKIKKGSGNNDITYSLTTGKMGGKSDRNILINKLTEYNLINNKHIPNQYKCNSRKIRLQLLAGLIDTDGYYNKVNNSLEITQKNKKLADDILWVVRSLGFRGMMKICEKSCKYKGETKVGQYHRIIITGKGLNEIPSLLERKRAREYKQIKNCLNTGITVTPLEEGEYFGFQIDGNARFLLGDFTVTHNTSLAKRGLSDCLKDDKGNSRPFAMIQMGGDSNGSTLHGHNYTYVGSTWGSIVQILIDKKCMNPIIFIDEVDKISRTEHGKEIVGILTHLLDPAQNDCFQDKYFTGIDLDLSKALFILSYNDVDAIDKILLDRVHRIKFNSLSLEDKLIICNTHILPEVYKKMGLEDMIYFSDDVLKFVIDEYTAESGVRKLKEILFEIVGEINLDVLKYADKEYELPIRITIDEIKSKYFKDKHEIKLKKIHSESKVGVINGLWANSLGRGGVIPIQVGWRPSQQFLSLNLTGMQGDVMKESMNVALTLAWDLTSYSTKKEIREENSSDKNINGVHIHCPEGSTPKDGPSAGTAITTAIYSMLNKKKIKFNIAITGEICLNGNVTEIGGLDLKILGAIKAGVKEILFPFENMKDYNNFLEKYKDTTLLDGIKFHPVSKIQEVFELVFED
jgi:ATP-dependent Lon protease